MRNETFPLNDPAGLGIFLVIARALAPAPFQPDFNARWPNAERSRPHLEPERDTRTDTTKDPVTAPTEVRPRKRGWLERLDRWFWAQQQRDIEAYLARSEDVHDLEQRMRNLERSQWHRYN
jgi:hypothetical protein